MNHIIHHTTHAMKTNAFIKKLFLFVTSIMIYLFSNAQVNVGPIPVIPKGKSIKIVYNATININLPQGTTSVKHQGTVSGNFTCVLSNTETDKTTRVLK